VNPGKPGAVTAVMRVYVQNGQEVRREQIGVGAMTAAMPRIIRVSVNDSLPETVWDLIAQCKVGGNWSINSGNGYYGGLQLDAGTWRTYGGTTYAPLPSDASREQQITIGEKVRDDRGGFGAWPACAHTIGLSD